jgi:isocitrate/isopropylmalate dehydrogenase
MARTITVIPGDGIGPEVTDATLRILDESGAELEYDEQFAGVAGVERLKSPLPDETLASIRRNRVCAQGTPHHSRSARDSAPSTWRCGRSSTCTQTCVRP